MSNPLDISGAGPTQIWTISLPDVGNAITGKDFIAAFEAAVDSANADTAVARRHPHRGGQDLLRPAATSRRWRTRRACSA